jgi:alcohol dehydrogenase, propanol-preferring
MRALQMVGWQRDPELREIAVPVAQPGEILVRVAGAGVCHSDIHVLYEFPESFAAWPIPMTLGHETAGWVDTLGDGVDGPPVGTPVAVYGPWGCGICRMCAEGAENYCRAAGPGAPVGGLGRDGGMAEYLIVPSPRFLVPIPDGLSPEAAAPLTDAGLTPYHAIRRADRVLTPGSVAVVMGVGGLGHLAVQILKATTAATVVAIDPRAVALELATACGADVVLRADDDPAARIRDLTGGRGAEAVFDMVATDGTLAVAAAMVAGNGHIGVVGAAGGTIAVSMGTVPFGVTVTPTYWGTRPELIDVLDLAAAGRLVVRTEQFPLSRATDAYAAVRDGKVAGRAVVIPGH